MTSFIQLSKRDKGGEKKYYLILWKCYFLLNDYFKVFFFPNSKIPKKTFNTSKKKNIINVSLLVHLFIKRTRFLN
jgi:hypothetical protein